MNDLNEAERKRFKVLERICDETEADERTLIDDKKLAEAMGIAPDEVAAHSTVLGA